MEIYRNKNNLKILIHLFEIFDEKREILANFNTLNFFSFINQFVRIFA